MGPHPAVAAIRLAVRRVLHDILNDHSAPHAAPEAPRTPPLVLVACSGGADSMALASALAFEAPKLGIRAGGVTVDHGLQPGSDLRAAEVVARLTALRLDPVESAPCTVGRDGGPEAAARDARYAALDAAADRHGAAAILLGHTRDDQAETVLLGLARGSGIRSLSGMAATSGADGRYRGPSCTSTGRPPARRAWPSRCPSGTTRTTPTRRTRAPGCATRGCPPWRRRSARVSSRRSPVRPSCPVTTPTPWTPGPRRPKPCVRDAAGLLECAKLYALPPAVRRRVLRRAAIEAGAPAGSLFARHIEEVDRLITGWRGQGAINLPGKVVAQRQGGRLVIRQG